MRFGDGGGGGGGSDGGGDVGGDVPSSGREIEELIGALRKLPSLGPRSARRAALRAACDKTILSSLIRSLTAVRDRVGSCSSCGNADVTDPCSICRDSSRDWSRLCVVEDLEALWALERASAWRGGYHVLGGALSAVDGVGPEDLRIESLARRVRESVSLREVVIATGATLEGQTTAHYIVERLRDSGVETSRPAHGIPLGGAIESLDDATLEAALAARSVMTAARRG